MNKYTRRVQKDWPNSTHWGARRAREAKRTGLGLLAIGVATGLAVLASLPSEAASLAPGHIACISEQTLDQAYDAVAQDDARMLEHLGTSAMCAATSQLTELDVTFIESTWDGTATVRFWLDGQPHHLYVPAEAVRE